jgi:hypothetical protein
VDRYLRPPHKGQTVRWPRTDRAQVVGLVEVAARAVTRAVEIEGENMRPVTWVVVEEVRSGQ